MSLYSKLPCRNLTLQDLCGRPAMTGCFNFESGGSLAVSSVHLTSGANAGIRRQQLSEIYSRTAQYGTSLVAGDMNTCQPHEDNRSVEADGFIDVWARLYPSDPGMTMGPYRLDRAALRSCAYVPLSMEIVGRERVPCTPVSISDHFGFTLQLGLAGPHTNPFE